MFMCQVHENQSNLLDHFVKEFNRVEYLRELCLHGSVTNIDPLLRRKRILYRGKSGQILEDELNNQLLKNEEEKDQDNNHNNHNNNEPDYHDDDEVMDYNRSNKSSHKSHTNNSKSEKNGRTNQYRVKSSTKEVRFENNSRNRLARKSSNKFNSINRNKVIPVGESHLESSGSSSSLSKKKKGWFERFNCFQSKKLAAMQAAFLEFTKMIKPPGPHGRYCLCGCRGPSGGL